MADLPYRLDHIYEDLGPIQELCEECAAGESIRDEFLADPSKPWKDLRWWRLGEQMPRFCDLCQFAVKWRQSKDPDEEHEDILLTAYRYRESDSERNASPSTIYLSMCLGLTVDISDTYVFEKSRSVNVSSNGLARRILPLLNQERWTDIKRWYNHCENEHGKSCAIVESFSLVDFVVIDCRTRTIKHLPDGCQFAALSYVWGTGSAPQYTMRLASKLEKVIEDAIVCTQQIGLRYLWTDRYCIDQNSATKDRIIQHMDQIYWNASITIIDAAGNNAEAGLSGVTTNKRLPLRLISLYGEELIVADNPTDTIFRSQWATRGWTYQEGLLSRRRLVFTNAQVYFQCLAMHCCEDVVGAFHSVDRIPGQQYDMRSRSQAFSASVSQLSGYAIFQVCQRFSMLNLTYESDALKALLGVFLQFWEGKSPAYHFWGLPFFEDSTFDFLASLLWEASWDHGGPLPARRDTMPSWSLISWKGCNHFGRESLFKHDHTVHVSVSVHEKQSSRKEKRSEMSIPADGLRLIEEYVSDIQLNETGFLNYSPYLFLTGWFVRCNSMKKPMRLTGVTAGRIPKLRT